MAFNLFDHSLRAFLYADQLLARLAAQAVLPALVEVEVLETILMGRDTAGLGWALRQLRGTGVSVALDGFGTGFASLLHLRDLTHPHDQARPRLRPRPRR